MQDEKESFRLSIPVHSTFKISFSVWADITKRFEITTEPAWNLTVRIYSWNFDLKKVLFLRLIRFEVIYFFLLVDENYVEAASLLRIVSDWIFVYFWIAFLLTVFKLMLSVNADSLNQRWANTRVRGLKDFIKVLFWKHSLIPFSNC